MWALQTKEDFQKLAWSLLNPLKPFYSAGGARVALAGEGACYEEKIMEMEAFARPLWALAPLWKGGAEGEDFAQTYRRGLAAGCDESNPEYWGDPGENPQLFVEMASIACAILLVPEKVWQPLTQAQKERLAAWLNTINQHPIPECNWLFFLVLVNLALRAVEMPYSAEKASAALDKIDSYYVGDGWYTDGPATQKPQKDYYVPWAMQYYGVLYSVFAAQLDPVRATRFRERALLFGKQFCYWFDENGAALPFGRSLSYRFAQSAFYSACIFAGIQPLPLGQMKGIVVRNIQWWMEKEIFSPDGILTVGYCYAQMYMAERYNAPGSPYWAMKAFILLALPDTDAFWRTPAAPLLALAPLKKLPCADMLMQRLPDGQVNGYPAGVNELYGHGVFPAKYAKFVYNTRLGFSVPRSGISICETAPDSMLAFEIDDHIFVRRVSRRCTVRENSLVSVWSPFAGIEVETTITLTAQGHRRQHLVKSKFACKAYDCGFAIPWFESGFEKGTAEREAFARTHQYACHVRGSGTPVVLGVDPNTSLYFKNTVLPAILYDIRPGETAFETEICSFCKA
ncbi:MAG: DUF2264 domain-containing protein [Gemmiger sp.]|nr:DUF2264 domain-containing protein [Gemmiger sp.]